MAEADFVELVLKCGSWQEAQAIADVLLEKKLVACVEFLEVKSRYRWQGKMEEADEIKLIMETVAANFDKVEKEAAKLHNYDTFVLQQLPLTNLSEQARRWLTEETEQ